MSEPEAINVIHRVIKDRWPNIPRLTRQEMAEAIARELASELERDDGDDD
jgi:hypothetical protein